VLGDFSESQRFIGHGRNLLVLDTAEKVEDSPAILNIYSDWNQVYTRSGDTLYTEDQLHSDR
jgi:hypothetical protein